MLSKQKETQTSKKLSYVLRHGIVENRLTCNAEGYVKVKDLFDKHIIDVTIEQLQYIVENSEKKRFSLIYQNNEYFIKANQGHSLEVGTLIDDDVALEQITEPCDFCAHGTEEKYIQAIRNKGLCRMNRKHIHMVNEISKKKQISGYKSKSNCIVVINMLQCMNDGMVFYKSANGVILTEGFNGVIHPKYFIDIIPN
jgi:2'-phosphotransferase